MLFSATVADPFPITRYGTTSLLANLGGRVITGVKEGSEVLELLSAYDLDLLVTELGLQGFSGLEMLRRARKQHLIGPGSSTDVLVLTTEEEEPWVSGTFRLGVAGYVLKSDPVGEVEAAIRAILRDERFLTGSLPPFLMEEADPVEEVPDSSSFRESLLEGAFDRLETLTERQWEILQLTARGLTSQQIGEDLGISPRTVEKHRERLKSKLQAKNVVEMVAYAIRRGILSRDVRCEGRSPPE